MALSSYKYALIAPRLEKIMAQNVSPKVQEWQSYGKFRKVTLNPHFSEKLERGDEGKFFKNLPKSRPRLKGPKAHLRKWHYPLITMHVKGKDWKRFWGKKVAPKVPEWPSYGNFGKVAQNPHFLKKCKGGTNGNFSKIAKKVALVWNSQKRSGANGIIL